MKGPSVPVLLGAYSISRWMVTNRVGVFVLEVVCSPLLVLPRVFEGMRARSCVDYGIVVLIHDYA